jgi:hypothetical protein
MRASLATIASGKLADRARRNADDDSVGGNAAADDRAGGDHRAIADGDARQDDRAVPARRPFTAAIGTRKNPPL